MQSMYERKPTTFANSKMSRRRSVFDSDIKNNLFLIENRAQGYELYHDKSRNCRVEVYIVKASKATLGDTLDIYEWRFGTQMPIVKTCFVEIRYKENQHVYLNVFNEHCEMKLETLYELPFNQVLYLMKEAIVGLERIYSKFGPFQLTSNMISINERGQCKVWYNQNNYSNLIRPAEVEEPDFLVKLLSIFQERTLRTSQTKRFFRVVYEKCQTFIETLKFIEHFVRIHRIKVPAKFSLNCSSSVRQTFRRNSALMQEYLRHTYTNRPRISLNNSLQQQLVNSLDIGRIGNNRASNIISTSQEMVRNNSSNDISRIKKANIPMVTSIMSPSNMKGSGHTTNAHTHFDPTRISNQFSNHDWPEDPRKTQKTLQDEKKPPKSGLKISSEIQLSTSDIGYRRNYSIDKLPDNPKGSRFAIQKSQDIILNQYSSKSPKAIQIEQYQEPEKQIHEQQIEEERQQSCQHWGNSGSDQKLKSSNLPEFGRASPRRGPQESQEEQEDEELMKSNQNDIMQRNGWKVNLGLLDYKAPMKQSVQIGKEVNMNNDNHMFQFLKSPNLLVYQSIIPNDRDFK